MIRKKLCPKRKLCLGFATGCGVTEDVRCPLKNAFLGSCEFIAYLGKEVRQFKARARAIEKEDVKLWTSPAAKSSIVASNAHVEMYLVELLRTAKDMMIDGKWEEYK